LYIAFQPFKQQDLLQFLRIYLVYDFLQKPRLAYEGQFLLKFLLPAQRFPPTLIFNKQQDLEQLLLIYLVYLLVQYPALAYLVQEPTLFLLPPHLPLALPLFLLLSQHAFGQALAIQF